MKLIISIATRPDAGFESTTFQSIDIPLNEKDPLEEQVASAKLKSRTFLEANVDQALRNHYLAAAGQSQEKGA